LWRKSSESGALGVQLQTLSGFWCPPQESRSMASPYRATFAVTLLCFM
jgi:hypothetical protein